jgi:DNA-binding MarR family transcriptional regulator
MAELRCIGSERLLRVGVSMTQLHVISMLDRHGDMPMSRLAEMLDVSVSNATGLVDRMEERGVVERVRVPDDRRVVLVRITLAGRTLLDDVEVLRVETLKTVLDHLDEHQLEGMARAAIDLHSAITAVVATPGELDHDHTTETWRA